jgi:hypothetical protein
LRSSDADTRVALRKLRLRFGDFFVRMCDVNAFLRLILPVPVSLKRFLAPLLLLTLGMFLVQIVEFWTEFKNNEKATETQ